MGKCQFILSILPKPFYLCIEITDSYTEWIRTRMQDHASYSFMIPLCSWGNNLEKCTISIFRLHPTFSCSKITYVPSQPAFLAWHKVCFIVCSQLPSAGLFLNISLLCRMDWPCPSLVIIPQRQQVFACSYYCVCCSLCQEAMLFALLMMNLFPLSSLSSILNSSERWLDTSHLYIH